ncbi:MAG: class I SAM-dependent methyltransferase [Chloroflexi bacterium]|nr:class I SAM-dependent methyltransferase [Chloroflexota bacterium]
MATTQPLDDARVQAFIGKALGDWGALTSASLVVIGDKLGLYTALSEGGPATPAELAQRTGTVEGYVRPWLINQAAGGYLEYSPETGKFSLPPEHAAALGAVVGAYYLFTAAMKAEPRITEGFKSGQGMLWGEHAPELFGGTERFFRSGYEQNLVQNWIPAMDGMQAKLATGAVVADVGCGHGASTIILAQAFPHSRFIGYDNHGPSVEHAREAASAAGLGEDRVSFQVAPAIGHPAVVGGYDLIAFFDSLHDMGDPVGAIRHAADTLASDGSVLLVEPMAGEHIEDNLNPVGQVYSGASVLICTPHAMAESGRALGTIAPDSAIRDVVQAGGLTRFRRVTETPVNRVFEARR